MVVEDKKQDLTYYFRIMSSATHPLQRDSTPSSLLRFYEARPSHIRPFNVRMRSLIENLSICDLPSQSVEHLLISPWTISQYQFDCQFVAYNKAQVSPIIFQQLFTSHRHQFSQYAPVFTDGSKSPGHVGCGVVIADVTYNFKIPDICSIFTAEAGIQEENKEMSNRITSTNLSSITDVQALLSVLGEVASVRKLRSGDLLVQTTSEKQATALSKCTNICNFNVTVTPHKSLNTCRGVISQTEFIDDEESMILENLQDQHVVEVRRIKIQRNGQLIPTKHLILTFASPTLPSAVKLAWYNCPVRPYVPNPLRCFQCQRFGHSQASCRGTSVSARCSTPGHSDTSCEFQPLCVNCKGAHEAYSRSCPRWSEEKEIQSVKVLQNLTFNEAHRIVTARTPRPGVSYSTVAKTSFCSVGTQTDFTAKNLLLTNR
nr:uncharacterized protein LOC122273002 [Parasteatoda tepidariorum]